MYIPDEILNQTPCFILIKNLKIQYPSDYYDISSCEGEFIDSDDNYYNLRERVPRVSIPKDPEKKALYCEKYVDFLTFDFSTLFDKEDNKRINMQYSDSPHDDHSQNEEVPDNVRYSDSPQDFYEEYDDFYIFGESYTIVWLCNENSEITIDGMMQFLNNRLEKRKMAGVHGERIDVVDLAELYENCLDRSAYWSVSIDTAFQCSEDRLKHLEKISSTFEEGALEELDDYL